MHRNRTLIWLAILTVVVFLVACNQQEETSSANEASSSSAMSAESGHGKEIYDSVCHSCHSTGVAGAPKLGDQAAWKDRIGKGVDTLVQSALNGKGNMPPKGGERSLNESDIRAAVNYMVNQSR